MRRLRDQTNPELVSSETFFMGRASRHTLVNRAGLNLLVLRPVQATSQARLAFLGGTLAGTEDGPVGRLRTALCGILDVVVGGLAGFGRSLDKM